MTLLTVTDMTVAYGSLVAVANLSFTVAPGEILALLGANGAGKTSTLRAMTGLAPLRGGSVRFGADDVSAWDTARLARAGIAHVPAGRGVFGGLTVQENLQIGLVGVGVPAADRQARLEEVLELFPVLHDKRGVPAINLSGGQQQQLVVSRALLQRPRLLLIDEMSMGLAPNIVGDLFSLLGKLREERDLAIVVVEQFVGQALELADTALVMESGRASSYEPAHVTAATTADLEAAYLGGSAGNDDPKRTEPTAVALDAATTRRLTRIAARRGISAEQLVLRGVDAALRKDDQ